MNNWIHAHNVRQHKVDGPEGLLQNSKYIVTGDIVGVDIDSKSLDGSGHEVKLCQ